MSYAERVVVLGQGYVGLPLAIRASEVGFDVVGLDVDQARVDRLRARESFVEDISNERLAAAMDSGRYRVSADLADAEGFDIAIISVPTPLKDGTPDLRFVEAASRGLAPWLRRGATVILESTTYPGTTEELVGPLLAEGSGLAVGDFHLGYSPERIDPGNQHWTLETTPKVVSGVDAASLAAIDGFFSRIVERTVPVGSPKEAELAKLLENTFRHVNIALVNELAMYAADLGVDVWEVIGAAATKPFGFMPFYPGPGVGGHCLPIDPSYLSWRVRRSLGVSFRFVDLANDVNEHMPDYVVRRLVASLNRHRKAMNGSTVLVLGLSYKRNTGDARESPAVRVVELLVELGANVRVTDPHVPASLVPQGAVQVELTHGEIGAADAVVLLTDHEVFDLDLVGATSVLALDTRGVLTGPNVERL